ncbi:MAG: hypothetical protein AAGE94_20470 [Acidobacteriota bacterium]
MLRPQSRLPLLLLAVLLTLVCAQSAVAYDLFEIHTAGVFAGEVRINGEFVNLPDGACGIDWDNVVAWHWGPSAGSPVQSGFGGDLWYTVGYSTCADTLAPYSFVTPVTPTGDPANNVLVVQADVEDAVWLNWALDAIPGPELGPDHDFPSICERVPEFCEPVVDEFTIPHPCDVNPELCGVDIALLDLPMVIETTRHTAHEIGHCLGLRHTDWSPKGRTEIEASLTEARRRLANAQIAAESVGAMADEIRLDPQSTSDVFVATAGTFVAAARFGVDALDRAEALLADLTHRSSVAEIEAALAEVERACRLFETATTGAQDGVTFGGLSRSSSPNR